MENDAERMMMQMMAGMMTAKQETQPAAAPSFRIDFFERDNSADTTVEGVFTRMKFMGYFGIDGYLVQREDGSPVEAGLGADFDEANGPIASWVWFSNPVDDTVKSKFEEYFDSTFDETAQRMDIDPEAFLAFSDSKSWGICEEAEPEDDPLW